MASVPGPLRRPLTSCPLTRRPLTSWPLTRRPLTRKPLTRRPLTSWPLTSWPQLCLEFRSETMFSVVMTGFRTTDWPVETAIVPNEKGPKC